MQPSAGARRGCGSNVLARPSSTARSLSTSTSSRSSRPATSMRSRTLAPPLRCPRGVLASSGVCIDLVPLMPRYASPDAPVAQAPFALLWQHWRNGPDEGAPVDIDLVEADGVWEHRRRDHGQCFRSLRGQRKSRPRSSTVLPVRWPRPCAAGSRTEALRWLVPDIANDFTLEVLRRNLNAKFADAQPLPRSVAAIFAQVDLDRVTHGFSVVVVDSFAGTRYATKLSRPFRCRAEGARPGDPWILMGAGTLGTAGGRRPRRLPTLATRRRWSLARADGTYPGRSH